MDTIVVDKTTLIAVMKENREKHHQIVLEAQAGFRAKVIERLDEMLKLAASGAKINLAIGLTIPEDHTEDYDTIIGMLEFDIGTTVEIDRGQYQCWVQDKWGWQRSFTQTNSVYSSTAASNL